MFSIKPRKHDDITEKYRKFLCYSFPRPSILEGLARIFDLGGTIQSDYYPTRTPYEIDIAAMRSDWIEIGRDFDLAIGAFTDGGNSEHRPMSDIEGAHLPDRPSTQRRDDLTTEASQTTVASAPWLGPLPPLSVLRSFDEVLPGSAERILVMAEQQSDHRMLMENTIVRGDSNRSYLGLVTGFVLSAMVILGGFYLIYQGHDLAGTVLIGLNLVGLAAVFVYGSNSRRLPPLEVSEVADENTLPDTD